MGVEIERKFLVKNDGWRSQADGGTLMSQGYLISDEKGTVRVRLEGDQARLNIKSMATGVSRLEFEYPIPAHDARQILSTLSRGPAVEKTRYRVRVGAHTWEVDEFSGDNQGLVVAEVELASEDEAFTRPDWSGEEVSEDPRYLNANLAERPWKTWGKT